MSYLLKPGPLVNYKHRIMTKLSATAFQALQVLYTSIGMHLDILSLVNLNNIIPITFDKFEREWHTIQVLLFHC